MKKTAIVYYSKHHGNTKKLLDAIKSFDPDLELIDVTEKPEANLTEYDRIGFASGAYYSKFAEQLLNFAKVNLPEQKGVFFICTAGNPVKVYFNAIADITAEKQCNELGRYMCKGFDTFGPFKLVGGIQKGHPTEDEISGAVEFYKNL
ncbi:flavodoxin domain-containing protein [Butyrivibrio proteoclasticus]|uniref:flavodoxin domain-containing protein n=1 Tax=Butyrivibrio proteoclasticus TaxID=43305 RepID=UPI00047D0B42|nr:flavodoxin domain-containing protein [Butyrivibrio proteoclasticus]